MLVDAQTDLSEQAAAAPLSKTQFAAAEGLSKGRISQLVAQGMPVMSDGRIDPAAARSWMAENLNPVRRQSKKAASPDSMPGLTAIRTEREGEQLKLLRLDYEKRLGNLIDRAAAEAAIFTRARLERDAHLSWVVRTAPVLAGQLGVSEAAVFAALDREMRRHLEELSGLPLAELARS